jgi:pimeloyl-ACP methyl ester carboxylesterase
VEYSICAPDGRVLAVEESGDPAGRPVLVHGGTPGSRHLYGPVVRDAAARGLRLISYDRPGYGGSSPRPGRTVASCVGDVRAICAELGIDRLAMWGMSGGGPHVLACAALLPELVTAAASLASVAPHGAEGLDYYAGMGQENVDDDRLFFTDEAAARAKTDKDREEILATPPEDAAKAIESLLTPTDAAVLRGELAEYLICSERDALAPGSQGWWDDTCLLRPWDSTWPTSLSRSCCCTAGRTCSCRSATANGWPRTFPASKPGCSTTMAT